jgi:hypothetical protein
VGLDVITEALRHNAENTVNRTVMPKMTVSSQVAIEITVIAGAKERVCFETSNAVEGGSPSTVL